MQKHFNNMLLDVRVKSYISLTSRLPGVFYKYKNIHYVQRQISHVQDVKVLLQLLISVS